jgi:cholest-4-en-3-one 26-monooxygenase
MDPVDLTDPDTYSSGVPHEEFRRLRAELPVAWREEGYGAYWAVTRYQDAVTALRDLSLYSSWRGGALLADPPAEFLARLREGMMHRDPPDHAKLRALVSQVFRPRRLADLEVRIAQYVRALVDSIRGSGRCDFGTAIAEAVPQFVICEILGVPAEDRQALQALTARMVGTEMADPSQALRDGIAAAQELRQYATDLGRAKRARPADDMVTDLLTAEVGNRRLSEGEFQAFFMLLFNAGSDTTRSVLCYGLDLLLDRPQLLERLRAEPSLLPAAIEEMFRHTSPVIHLRRTANRDTELGGTRIAEGDKVVVFLPSANRDEAVFREPDRFDLERTVNPHVAFGYGPHYCLGGPLARLECRHVFTEILAKLNGIQRTRPIVTARSNFIRRVSHFEISFW